jgi:hypothetical protein
MTPMSQADNQNRIIRYAVLTGLTPLIPIPFLDDVVKSYFQRRLTRRLAQEHGVTLDEATVRALSDDAGGSCLLGCLGTVVVYPIKKLLRKIFIFLEWKRSVDFTSLMLHRGFLLDAALRNGHLAPAGPRSAAEVRAAIDAVVREAPVKPVEEAVRGTFRQSKGILMGAAAMLQGALQGVSGKAQPDEVAAAVESVREKEDEQISGVVASLQGKLFSIPGEHFKNLERKLLARLE